MQLPKVAVSALLLQDRGSNENGPDSGFYYWLCTGPKKKFSFSGGDATKVRVLHNCSAAER